MFIIVGIKVVQGKAVVAGKEVYAGIIACIAVLVLVVIVPVHVPGTENAPGGVKRQPGIPLEESAEGVPVPAVPLRPASAGGKTSHLIHSSGVPGFRDQFYIAEEGIGGEGAQKRRIVHGRAVFVPSQNAGEIEAESVDAVIHRPVTQTFQDKLLYHRMITVQGVSAAAEIVVIAVGREHIVNIVVQSLETESGAVLVTFRRMVEHYVQNYFDPVVVERFDQGFQLCSFPVVFIGGGVAAVG